MTDVGPNRWGELVSRLRELSPFRRGGGQKHTDPEQSQVLIEKEALEDV
jgi:hypothetical protein